MSVLVEERLLRMILRLEERVAALEAEAKKLRAAVDGGQR